MGIIWWFLPGILLFAAVTSYEDWKYGKIRNRWIISAIGYAVILYIIIMLLYGIDSKYFILLFSTSIIAALIGFGLWWGKFWSAGDGKLFFAYSLLIPLEAYGTSVSYFSSIMLLVNTFVPFLAYSVIYIAFFTTLKSKKEAWKNFNVNEFGMMILNVFWINWISRVLLSSLGISNFFISLILTMGIYLIIGKYSKSLIISLVLTLFRIFADWNYLIGGIKNEIWMVVSSALMFALIKFGSYYFSKKVGINELKVGMILSEKIFLKDKHYVKLEGGKAKELDLENPAEGLTKKDVKKIKDLWKEGKLKFSEIRVQQTLPFAPFMAFGVLLTLIAKGSFLNLFF